jgi:DNA-binding beta-propeller fold protein YncE
MQDLVWRQIGLLFVSLCLLLPVTASSSFVTFESGQVRPLAMSPDGSRLFAVNTPDNRLEIFDIKADGLTHVFSIPVGMEPVAVAARTDNEIWVVNHLSDSISIVDLSGVLPRVSRTLLVGDEPRDIVFAGPGGNRAFITAAHRGQNSPYTSSTNPGEMTTPGIGRADVWVFNALSLGSSLGGDPLTIVTLFTDTPRALAVSLDGSTVYAAGFHTGNKTAVINQGAVCDGGATTAPCTPGAGAGIAPGGLPAPNSNVEGKQQPEVGLIVKHEGAAWVDELGRNWNNQVLFSLPDRDVFAINANAHPPAETGFNSGVGTVLFNMVINPANGKLYVSNTEARNEVRFEGGRPPLSTTTTVQGHLHEARITVIDGSSVTPRHLNKHIDYTTSPAPAGTKEKSLATPLGMAISSDGGTLYLAAFGSAKIGIFNTAALENNSFVPNSADHISLSGGGPSGVVLDESRNRLYVLTRFDNALSIIDTISKTESAHLLLHNPEPANVVNGRPFLYDATFTSSNGEASCSSCHIFGDLDSLAWDLGDPEGTELSNPNPDGPIGAANAPFHPMKGPMTTQSLRGLANHGPMHWRGDRTAGRTGGDPLDENAAFREFNVAFEGLLGRDGPIPTADMQAFADFVLDVTYPSNPIRVLDNSLTTSQQNGSDMFFNNITAAGNLICNNCHVIDPPSGFFGSSGLMSFEGETQFFKIPHLRNMYQKVGMFGMPFNNSIVPGDGLFTGDQIRGFGFLHDGSADTLFRFHGTPRFSLTAPQQRDLEQFMFASPTNLAPIIGQQITLNNTNTAIASPRINLMLARAAAGENDIIVKGMIAGTPRGWHRIVVEPDTVMFQSDIAAEPLLSEAQLRALAGTTGQDLTYTATPLGTGLRMGIDRDEDGFLDNDDNCPAIANADQVDGDSDGAGDACDNCQAHDDSSAAHRDSNGDGFGNMCDADLNNDGATNTLDLNLYKQAHRSSLGDANYDADADFNGDGTINTLDLNIYKGLHRKPPGPSCCTP